MQQQAVIQPLPTDSGKLRPALDLLLDLSNADSEAHKRHRGTPLRERGKV